MAKRPSLSSPVIKSLFAYSGNQCAMPTCVNPLVDASGTILGKIAHICSASPGGARHDKSMTEAERHSAPNLFIVCAACHDVIDDPRNEATYPALLLRKYKKQHEDRFRKAERQLIQQFVDTTQINQPVYPKTLKAYGADLERESIARELADITNFIDNLKEQALVAVLIGALVLQSFLYVDPSMEGGTEPALALIRPGGLHRTSPDGYRRPANA